MIRGLLAAGCLLAAIPGFAQEREVTLAQLIAELQSQGYRIIYSDRLVHGDQRVSVPEVVDLAALRVALAGHGLGYRQIGDILTVVAVPAGAVSPAGAAPLSTAELPLETVIVTGSVHRLSRPGRASSVYSLGPEELTVGPNIASDVIRAASRLPGMSTIGVSAKPRIRGGLHDELLIMQDGVELLEPFHLADYHSAYSSFDYHTIESLDVYTGGFPSRYGNRMSGVMDIRNEWVSDGYDTDIGVSSFANFLHTRGRFGEQRPGNWLLSLRQGDLSDLTDYIQSRSGEPEYGDVSTRVTVALSNAISASAGLAYAEDDVLFRDEEERSSAQVTTHYGWGALDWALQPTLYTRLTVSWLDFEREKQLSSFEMDEEDPGKGGALDHRQSVQRFALRNDWSAVMDSALLEYGWQAEYSSSEYRHRSFIDRGELALILGNPQEVVRRIEENPSGWSGGAYVQAEWAPNPRLSLQPSLRWDYQDYYIDTGAKHQVSPRIGLTWSFSDSLLGRVSAGRFYQPEGVQELQVLDGVTRFFPPQYADQLVTALEWEGDRIHLGVELYYKRYREQKERFENIFNPFVLLPEMEPDRVALRPDKALARGVDVDARWRIAGAVSAALRYSYMDARDRLEGEWVDRRWSQRHTVNAGIAWRGDTFSAALALTWHSGWHSTTLPGFVPEGTVIAVPAVLNNTELPRYFSLDASVRKHWVWARYRLEVYADIANISDRGNAAGIDFDIEEVEGGYALLPDREYVLGTVPSVGVTLSF